MKENPTLYHKALVAYLYFIQGVFLYVPGTTVLTYKTMPSYAILGFFSFATIPFSFKFISAPLIERYTNRSYGRRKTWVVISLLLASLFIILATKFTNQNQTDQKLLAFCLTAVIFMISLQDISTDALAVKQLNSAELASYLQCVMQSIGGVVGSMIYLELVSGQLYTKLGFNEPFLSVPQFYYCLAGLTLISALIIHLTYKQKISQQESNSEGSSLWEVVKHYKHFVNPKYRSCRQAITFLLYAHGLTYFSSSFTVELIKSKHISKDLLTTLSNIMLIPVFILTGILSKYWADQNKIHYRTRLLLLVRLSLMIIFFVFSVQSVPIFCVFYAIFVLLSNAQFFINCIIVNNVSGIQFPGMHVSMMASFQNLGNNSTPHLQLISIVGYKAATIFGFAYTFIIILLFSHVQKWIKSGVKQQSINVKSQCEQISLKSN